MRFFFCRDNGYANAPRCYVVHTLPVLLTVSQLSVYGQCYGSTLDAEFRLYGF